MIDVNNIQIFISILFISVICYHIILNLYHCDIVKLLIKNGAHVHAIGDGALRYASTHGVNVRDNSNKKRCIIL